jgi:hypothetical protein
LRGHGLRLSLAGGAQRAEEGESEPKENKVEKVGVFFDAQKMPANPPRLPRNSPQTHHQKPRFAAVFCENPLQKRHFHHKRKIIQQT